MNKLELIITQGPYSTFLEELASINIVSAIRLNTIMPVKEGTLKERLKDISEKIYPKILWIDLKARQLRIKDFANTPYTAVTISHKIKVALPATVYFDNGNITGKLVDIDGNKLILEDYVGRLLGPGESVNILDDTLEYTENSFLTEKDEIYVALCKELGIKHFMLSFVEKKQDIEYLKNIYPGSVIMSKIENKKGMHNLEEISEISDFIMAARGDLYTEIDYPHEISDVLKKIRETGKDKSVVGSRLLASLLKHSMPSCPDMMDLQFLKDMGYNKFLIGDDICFKRDILMRAIKIFTVIFS
ncbi:MAG: pyruvate kinase [Candidatus Eremiobacterota bacterium]